MDRSCLRAQQGLQQAHRTGPQGQNLSPQGPPLQAHCFRSRDRQGGRWVNTTYHEVARLHIRRPSTDGVYSLAPYERRVIELLRNSKDKRARKLAKKRVC